MVVYRQIDMFLKIKFTGGLGNQLFQYATARALVKKSDFLLFDTSNYRDDYLNRKFTLLHYHIRGKILHNSYLKKTFANKAKLNKLISLLGLFGNITEEGFSIHNNLKGGCKLFTSLKGFWQSETYFISIREQLLKELKPFNVPAFPDFMQRSDTVAVHIRRTDYLQDERYGFVGEHYYRNALHIIKQKINDPAIIFFSDDIPWCKQVFEDGSMLFCEDPEWDKDYMQLYLMSKCKHQVIANSSFSWWGAWLNQNVNKIVIRPARPFIDKSLCYENHYPSDWIAI